MKVTTICESSTEAGTTELIGTNSILILITSIFEICVIMYLIRQFYFPKCNSSGADIPRCFQRCFFIYHTCFLLWIVVVVIRYYGQIFDTSTHDQSSLLACYVGRKLTLPPFTGMYLITVVFWLLRLKVIFKDTVYETSSTFVHSFLTLAFLSAITSFVCGFAGFTVGIIYTESMTSNTARSAPIVGGKTSGKCVSSVSCSPQKGSPVAAGASSRSVPTLPPLPPLPPATCAIVVEQTNDGSNVRLKQDLAHIRLNVIIAIISIGTTFITLLFYALTNMVTFFFFDGIINGILMISIFDFGAWIVRYCNQCYQWTCKRCCYRCACCCCFQSITSHNININNKNRIYF